MVSAALGRFFSDLFFLKLKQFFIIIIFLLVPFFVDAKDYDFYVDESAKSGGDGSVGKPFKQIESAIKKAEKAGGSNEIYIYKGDYAGGFTIGKSMSLIGEDDGKVVIAGTVTMADNSEIKNLTVKGGYVSVSVLKNAEVEIEDCIIRDFTKIGVDIAGGDGKLTIQGSKIKNGDGKAVYAQRGNRIKFINNEIYDNDEEGFDLRSDLKGVISGNYIHNNGESGIEVIVGKANLEISNNTIKNNKASAIAAQFYEDMDDFGDIDVKNNKLTDNSENAVDCKNTQGGSIPSGYWIDSIKMEGNSTTGNGDGVFGKSCKMKIEEPVKEIAVKEKTLIEEGVEESNDEDLIEEGVESEEELIMQEEAAERETRQQEVKLILEKNVGSSELSRGNIKKVEARGKLKTFFLGVNQDEFETAQSNLKTQEIELQKAIEILGGDYQKMSEGETLKTKTNEELSWVSEQKRQLDIKGNTFSLWGWIKKIFHF